MRWHGGQNAVWGCDGAVTVVDPAREEAGSSIQIYARLVGMEVAVCRWPQTLRHEGFDVVWHS